VTDWPTAGFVFKAVIIVVVAVVVPTLTVKMPDEAAYVLSPANDAV
jgi:conjugal transfer/entry exclusion protein